MAGISEGKIWRNEGGNSGGSLTVAVLLDELRHNIGGASEGKEIPEVLDGGAVSSSGLVLDRILSILVETCSNLRRKYQFLVVSCSEPSI